MSGPQRQPDADEWDCTCGHAWTDGIHDLVCITAQRRLKAIEADPNKAVREFAASQPKDLDGDRNVYLETVDRLEPDIAMIDVGAFNASAAISLKRIADALEKIALANMKI